MTVPHRIRLQGPWEVVPPGTEPHSEIREVKIPATWRELFGDVFGTALFRRAFNTPTNLDSHDRVFIRVPDQAGHVASCLLNGVLLSAVENDELAYDVSAHLKDFNQLELQIQCEPTTLQEGTGGLWQPVLLEIHSAS